MSAPAFTPGPWQIAEPSKSTGRCIWRGDGDELNSNWARICSHVNHEPDARLIAASPELYEALSEMVGLYGLCGEIEECAACSKAQTALAKARGEQ